MSGSTFTHELPRRLSEEESTRLGALVDDAIKTFDWERAQPVHVCRKKQHGFEAYRHAAVCVSGCSLGELVGATPEKATEAARKAVSEHQRQKAHEVVIASDAEGPFWHEQPTCHDCGRSLVRPPGLGHPESFVCPAVHHHPKAEALTAGQVLECGGAR